MLVLSLLSLRHRLWRCWWSSTSKRRCRRRRVRHETSRVGVSSKEGSVCGMYVGWWAKEKSRGRSLKGMRRSNSSFIVLSFDYFGRGWSWRNVDREGLPKWPHAWDAISICHLSSSHLKKHSSLKGAASCPSDESQLLQRVTMEIRALSSKSETLLLIQWLSQWEIPLSR